MIAPKNKRQFDCSWLVPEIKNLDRWLVCDLKGDYAKKPTKAVAGPAETERDRLKASWNDPANQTSFDVAASVAEQKGQGIIFALPDDGHIAVVDLDECFDESGSLRDWAEQIVHQALMDRLIVERSVSGTGAHIWFTKSVDVRLSGAIPEKTTIVEKPKPAKSEMVEAWDRDRAIALGAGLIAGSGTELVDGSGFVAWLSKYLRRWMKPTAPPSGAKPSGRPSASQPHRRVTAAELRERLGAPATGNVRCPAHDDRSPSLSIDDSPDGSCTVVNCFAGCSFEAIVAAIPGLRPSDLFESPPKPSRKRSQAETIEHDPDDPRPIVALTADEHIGTAEIMKHLAKLDDVFVHDGNVLVRVVRDDDRLVIEPLRKAGIRLAGSRSVRFVGQTGDRILMPNRVAEAIEASVDPSLFRRLRGLTQVPTMRADGSILSEPGFDPSSGLFYDPVRGLKFEPVHDKTSRDDARAAIQHLGELLVDFPFIAETDKDAWIAMVCSLACRRLFDLTPVFGITGRYPGSGKGRLVQIAAEIALGHEPGFREFGRDQAERKKELASSLSMGDRLVAFDNLRPTFADPAVAVMTTTTRLVARPPYGQTRTFDVSGVMTVVMGNSMTVDRDFVRRVVLVRLGGNPGVADREESSFRIRGIMKHVRQHRGAYLRSALTIVRAYLAAGRPSVELSGGVGSFEQWSATIRSAIVWAGGVDFMLASRRTLREADVDNDEHELVLEAVAAVMKSRRPEIEAKQIVDVAELEKDLSCRALITELRGRRIGTVLRHWKDVEHGDGRVLRNRQRKGRGSVWWVEGGSSPDEPDETV